MVRELTCIVCPLGCDLKVELDENKRVLSVSGNTCPRGKVYAENECVNPRRTVTSTVRCEDGSMISVKTDTTIPKGYPILPNPLRRWKRNLPRAFAPFLPIATHPEPE